ncbi:MAG: acyl-CoA dehydrogenase family protein, partial [Deltaproteobacteria bacterium]|nr:acyl-CoA dehydrogenase family protein [Deltaproteobacteria bacterium]
PLGGGFVLDPLGTHDVFIPEEASDEEKSLAQLANEFSSNEVLPHSAAIEAGNHEPVVKLFKKAGELGLLMAEVPTEYGGLGLGKVPTTFISENVTHQGSYSVAFMCHTGIATLPVMAFGTEAQKQKYLTKLATGEMIGAYSLTEPGAGSDALAGRTKAVLAPDGKHYLINGEKIFVTNGGFADLFTLFAKIDGEHFTAFLVERNTPGLTIGREEKKMGIHGSSTVTLSLKDAKVPVENVLGEKGKGHRIAFNVLNVGRWKLGAASVGACKRLIEKSIPYIKQRQQFEKPIADFELMRDKVATCAVATYLSESMVYRFAHTLDAVTAALDASATDLAHQKQEVLKEYAIEASIAKVFCSEALQKVADEAVQMFGGYGFCEDYEVERFYRDCRINRIFEGTNEINRLIIVNTILKRTMKGELPLLNRLQEILGQLKTGFPEAAKGEALGGEVDAVERLKRLAVYLAGVGVQKYQADMENQQMLLSCVADVIMDVYALESGVMRARKLRQKFGDEKAKVVEAMCRVAVAERSVQLVASARQALINVAEGKPEEFEKYGKALERIAPKLVTDTRRDRLAIAARIIEKEAFVL